MADPLPTVDQLLEPQPAPGAAPLPSIEQLLGPRPAAGDAPLPSVEQLLGPRPPDGGAYSGPAMDEYFSQGGAGHVLDLIGQGARDGWGAAPLGLSPETVQTLRNVGFFPGATDSPFKEFNEWIFRPAAKLVDAASRVPLAALGGIRAFGEAPAPPIQASDLGIGLVGRGLQAGARAIAGAAEAFPGGHLTGLPIPLTIPELEQARALDVIGKGEDGWKGTAPEPAPDASGVTIESIDSPALGQAFRPMRGQPATPYVQEPPAPTRLAQFLREQGGVADDGGELRAMDATKRPGLVNANGMSLDDAAIAAWEAGYFPEYPVLRGSDQILATEQQPGINELLDALRADLNGTPRYPEGTPEGAAAAEALRQARAHNQEIDQLGAELGLNPRDFTVEQFHNLAEQYRSGAAFEADRASMDEAAQADFAEAERRAQEWAESRGDAWLAEPEPQGRTLEDLENEYREEIRSGDGAAPALAGPGPIAANAGLAGTDQDALPAVDRERGSSAGDRSPGTAAAEPGRPGEPGRVELNPTRPFADPAPLGAIDKAGNIRLDKLGQPDDVGAVIRDAASQNGGFWEERRGTLSDGETLDLAEALGMDPATLDRKKIGDAFNVEEVRSARRLLIHSAGAVRDALVAAQGGDDAAIATLAETIARHEMIQGKVAQATAEAGRALRAFREQLGGEQQAADLNAFLKENTGRSRADYEAMANLSDTLSTPGQVSKLVHDSGPGTKGANIRNAIIYYWINALISGPVTHLRYSVGNAVGAIFDPLVVTPLASLRGAAREALGMEGERVYLGEAGAQLYSMMKGSRDGFRAAYQAFRTGNSPPLPGERIPAQFLETGIVNPLTKALPLVPESVGDALGIPGRGVAAIHSFFKSLRYEQEIAAQAYRSARQKGYEPGSDAFNNWVARLTANPTGMMMERAVDRSLKELYMSPDDYNSFAGRLTRAVNSYENSNAALAAKIAIPFLKIGSKITRNAFVDRSPLGLASSEVRGNLMSGTAAGDLQAAKIGAGVGLAGMMVLMTMEGLATGDGPSDPKARAVWLLDHKPNSIKIGPLWFPYQGLGALGMQMRFAANMTESARGWQGDDGEKLAEGLLHGLSRSVLDENWMRGLHDVLDAMYGDSGSWTRFGRNFAANWLPYSVGLGQVARAVDPYSRDYRSIYEAALARIPFASETLTPRRDRFGEPVPSFDGLPEFESARYGNDPTVKALEQLGIGVAAPERRIRGVQLTPEQYDDVARIGGRLAKLRLDLLTANPAWSVIPPAMRIELINQAVTKSHETAATSVLMDPQNPQILRQATAAKAAVLSGR